MTKLVQKYQPGGKQYYYAQKQKELQERQGTPESKPAATVTTVTSDVATRTPTPKEAAYAQKQQELEALDSSILQWFLQVNHYLVLSF